MFLTKKAEDAFNSLLKQAKEILEKDNEEEIEVDDVDTEDVAGNEYKEIINLIKQRKIDDALRLVNKFSAASIATFLKSSEFAALPEVERQNFLSSIVIDKTSESEVQEEVAKQTKKENEVAAEPTEPAEPAKTPEEETVEDINIDEIFGGADKEDAEESDAADTEGANLNSIPKPGEEGKKASIFEYLYKKAEDFSVNETLDVKTYPLEESVKNMVRSYCAEGLPKQDAVESALVDCKCPEADMHHYRQIAEDAANFCAVASQKSDLGVYNAQVENFLKQASEYKPEGNDFDRICEIAKSSSTAYEFLNKVANKLDEDPNKQYPGQKVFNDAKTVSFDGGFGTSPQHPGQKVLSTKDGGNAAVETNFPKAEKPQVDVYTDKVNRGKVTTINSLDGTIAFMQPLPFEKQVMGPTADYTGYVTGTKLEQFGKPDAAGPVAEAGHVTSNYLDKVFEVADKKDVVGNPTASVKSGLHKKANDRHPDQKYTAGENSEIKEETPDADHTYFITNNGRPAKVVSIIYEEPNKELKRAEYDRINAEYNENFPNGGGTGADVAYEDYIQTNSYITSKCVDLETGSIFYITWWNDWHSSTFSDPLEDQYISFDELKERFPDIVDPMWENWEEYKNSKSVSTDAGFHFHGVKKTATSKKAELKKKALIDAEQWLADRDAKDMQAKRDAINKIPEEQFQKDYQKYVESVRDEQKRWEQRFPHSGENSAWTRDPVSYEEFKKSRKQVHSNAPYVSYELNTKPEEYARKHPEYAHEYVFNELKSGKELRDLPKDIVESARKWEKEHNDADFNEVNVFGEVPVQTPDLPVVDANNYHEHNAGFNFHGLKKKADTINSDITQGSTGENDSFTGNVSDQKTDRKKKLTPEELEEARKRIESHDQGIQRANGFHFFLNKKASSAELSKLWDYVNELKDVSDVGYNTVMESAHTDDDKTFETVAKQELLLGLKQKYPQIDLEFINLPFAELKAEINPQPAKEESKPEEKGKDADKEKGKGSEKEDKGAEEPEDAEEGLGSLEDLLG
jgi:hypothetical protein